ncbi:hypothetical protein A1Q2_04181 [Trichosporon asahii var. asahii CBS 8904]|uniref:Fibronectin type-III domain-containing protein n=1 Tax=Trichosporon asahii var. asahii (strain CBS 8904) TaxID=1220162 RepID=K1VCE8_TRIAC|nr:hypothetical protein A1Q2_04181 [Trichosporon asahii var. asahii CBS 8904]
MPSTTASLLLALVGAAAVNAAPVNQTTSASNGTAPSNGSANAVPGKSEYPLVTAPGEEPYNLYEPLQQRVAIVNATTMAVSWNTYRPLDTDAVIHYGLDPLNLDRIATTEQTTFETSRTWSHHGVLTGLQPKTEYHYRVAYTNCFACNTLPTYTFTTPRERGDESAYSVAVVADMGLMGPEGLSDTAGTGAGGALGPNETNTIQSLVQNLDAYEHLIHIGDLAYADYFLKESVGGYFGLSAQDVQPTRERVVDKYEELNEIFYDQIQPISAQKAYMVAVGNHESNCDNGGVKDKANNITYTADYCLPGQVNFTAYNEHWRMPGKPGDTRNFWYSYDDGMVHYIILNFETDFGAGIYGPDEVGGDGKQMSGPRGALNEQIDWLKADLAAVDRSKTPWVLAFGHRPCLRADPVRRQRRRGAHRPRPCVLPLLARVQLHNRPERVRQPARAGLHHERARGHYDGVDALSNPLPGDIAHGIEAVYGWSRLTFANRTHLRQEFVAARNSSVLDSFWLYREHAEGAPNNGSGHGHGHDNGNHNGHNNGKGNGGHDNGNHNGQNKGNNGNGHGNKW